MEGITERTTETGIRVVTIDFVADPAKRSPEWQAQARAGYTNERDWRREMLRDRTVASGVGIYTEEFSVAVHVAGKPLGPLDGSPIVLGWDFGLSPACVWARVLDWGGLRVFREDVTWDGRGDPKTQGTERLAELVLLRRNLEYSSNAVEAIYCDPSGLGRAETDERTAMGVLQTAFGPDTTIIPGPMTFDARRVPMRRMLGKMWQGQPWLMISPSCTMLIQSLSGAYRYKQTGEGSEAALSTQPEKNAWSHIAEAFEYLVGGLYGMVEESREEAYPQTEIYEERSLLRAGLY